MNGAIAELFATAKSKPTSTSVITIGANHNFLFSRMNCQSSTTTCAFDISFNTSFRSVASCADVADTDANKSRPLLTSGATDPTP